MEKKDTLSSCSESEEQQMQLIQDKSYRKSCMVSFQRLHSHLKRLSNNDLKGSRTENGFGRAFATLFGQDFETFTGTMFLNVDQLEKQLDNNEFQEIGSMASFKVLETQEFVEELVQFMDMLKSRLMKEHALKWEYDSSVIIESNGTESQKQDTSSRSRNDADIRPIYDEEPMVEVQMTADDNVSATGQQHTEQPESNNEGEVDQIYIPNQCESEQALDVSAGTLLSTDLGISGLQLEPSSSKLGDFQKKFHKVVRLGINPMIQPEPEDLPKDNPKLEITVLRWQSAQASSTKNQNALIESKAKRSMKNLIRTIPFQHLLNIHQDTSICKSMSMLVKDTRSQDGIDDKDNDKGSKSRSQSMKEQAYNKEQRERPRPHELNDKAISLIS
ncbi:hypothetical protein Tco_0764961 [Tanacetum coccineum]